MVLFRKLAGFDYFRRRYHGKPARAFGRGGAVKKVILLFIIALAVLFPCFSQNMFLLGGEYQFFKPDFFSAGLGFNMKLYKEILQNDFSLNFGGMRMKQAEAADPFRFLFYVKDNLYISHDWQWVGLRAGIFASLGDFLFTGGGFAGICILPRSLIALTIDVSPGYTIIFREGETIAMHEAWFSLPLSLGIRFNLDKW